MRFLFLATLICSGAAHAAEIPSVELSPHEGRWQATYAFAKPVHEMRFARQDAKGNRAASWAPLDEAVSIVLEDGQEVVRRRDGQDFTKIQFSMEPRYVPLDKDYAPFSPFSDGGVLMHTGRFFACAPECGDADTAWPLAIESPANGHVVHNGKVHAGRVEFVDHGDGTNVYVGKATPVESSHLITVIDEAFPAQAREQLDTLFPRLMDFYAARLGALPQKPMLFASRDAKRPGGGYGSQGGVLPGQVFMHYYGPKLDKHDDPAAFAASVAGFFAHEAAHMYQRYEASDGDASSSWLHEGGADAFALLALVELGRLDEAARQTRELKAIDACAEGLGDHALKQSAERDSFDDYYRCGMLMHLAVEAAARRQSAGACDLFCVWRAFRGRVDAGADFSPETWFATVDELAGRSTGRFVREAALMPHSDVRAFFARGLREARGTKPAPNPGD